MEKINHLCRDAAAEGTVLLKNENNILPLKPKSRVAVFGRMQTSYYRSGTGSGGGVFLNDIPCILKSLKENDDLILDDELVKIYTDWVLENPFDDGGGVWAGEPWFQKEMPLNEDIVKTAAAKNDVALIVVGRTAGEDHDNANVMGSYLLTDDEEQMLKVVCSNFDKVIVALNCGNLLDLSFIDKYNSIKSVMYIWQGGMEGANAFAEILSGKLYPSGKLSDTQLYTLENHPTADTFGKTDKIVYSDDIYVGYRYFETFAPNLVRYPFGYGLGFTNFNITYNAIIENQQVIVNATVKNIGNHSGKEVVQVYYSAPDGCLGNPVKQLIGFAKTNELAPNQSETVEIRFSINAMASFDENGVTGNKACMVLLKGDYRIFLGTDVRTSEHIITFNSSKVAVTERLNTAMTPYVDFDVLKADGDFDNRIISEKHISAKLFDTSKIETVKEIVQTGDKGIKLVDVYNGKNKMEDFIAQLNDLELATLVCGEGMSSPKATPGTAGALGGQTQALSNYGIPVCCVADGPSGIKVSPGVQTTLVPNGTMLACSWNISLVSELFTLIGEELKALEVDSLLGPGLNIHRSPLCGRNFEYFSEDPYLSGKIGANITKGIAKHGGFATIKHFCCNNQEKARAEYDVIVSERALREIYLKPFEITVKEGQNVLIMTSYNSVNGFWCASNYDLTKTIIRDEWQFENIVMTDWWAKCNLQQGVSGNKDQLDAMVRSRNDLYMVCEDSLVKSSSILSGLAKSSVTRAQLQECCINICKWILKTNTFKKFMERGCKPKFPISVNTDNMSVVDTIVNVLPETDYKIEVKSGRNTAFIFKISSQLDSLAQIPITVEVDSSKFTITINGTNGSEIEVMRFVKTDWWNEHKIKLCYSNAVEVKCILIKQKN